MWVSIEVVDCKNFSLDKGDDGFSRCWEYFQALQGVMFLYMENWKTELKFAYGLVVE